MSRDPVDQGPRTPEAYHPYSLAQSNPHLWVDPTGLTFTLGGISIAGAITGVLAGLAVPTFTGFILATVQAAVLVCSAHFVATALMGGLPEGVPDALPGDSDVCTSRRSDPFVVRFQAQGSGLQKKFVYSGTRAMTVTAGKAALLAVAGQLGRRDLKARVQAFAAAAKWLERLPPNGLGPNGSRTFTNRGILGSVARVDIEIISGVNFTHR